MTTTLLAEKPDSAVPSVACSTPVRKVAWLISGWSSPGLEWKISPIPGMLRKEGWEVREFRPKGFGWGDIRDAGHRLFDEISKEKAKGRADEVAVIGYSMGGLIGFEADLLTNAKSVDWCFDYLITLGTPHRGTPIARLAPWSKSARQMVPGNEFLYIHDLMVPNAQLFCVGGFLDFVVRPHRAAQGCADRVLFIDHTHISMVLSKTVGRAVISFLKSKAK